MSILKVVYECLCQSFIIMLTFLGIVSCIQFVFLKYVYQLSRLSIVNLNSSIMAEERIRAINYNVEEIGKYMKSSKKRFEWVIGLNKKTHTITLDFSFISGKVKVVIDGRVILENEIPVNTSFQYPFTLDGFALNLIQQGQSCELRVNNKVFSHLYIQEKTEQEFTKEKGEFTIAPDKQFMSKINSNQQQKITLDIGNTKKFRKVKNDDGGDWGAFGGLGAPPGFELPPGFEQTTVTTESKTVQKTNQGSTNGIDFFADEQNLPTVPKQQQNQPVSLLETMQTVEASKPSQVNIQSLYQQSTPQNQFFTQIPGNLNFGTNQGLPFGQQQFQTTTFGNQMAMSNLNFSAPIHQSQNVQAQGFIASTQSSLPFPQTNISAINFNSTNQGVSNFQTNSFGLNQLYATNANMPNNQSSNLNSVTNLNLGINLNSNINFQTGLNEPTPSFQGTDFFNQPSEQKPKETKDPFSALQSFALESNFHTSNPTSGTQSNLNAFFTQANVNTSNKNEGFSLI